MLRDRVVRLCVAPRVDHASGGRERLCLKRSTALLLLVFLAGLSAFANASPPDPIWLPGIYDGADYDDAVALLTDTAGVGDSPLLAVEPVPIVLRFIPSRSASARADASLLGFNLRAPPSA